MVRVACRSTPVRYVLMIEAQQGLTYANQLAIARRAEANGFEAFFRSDHYASFPGPLGHPTTDAWAVLAGLARDTERIGLGVLVSPVTFRRPGSFAKVVTTVDEMSGGRIEVGVGAGWNEVEHRQLGLPFPSIEERADSMEDQLAILHGLWGEPDGWSYHGHHVKVEDAMFHPKPVQVPGRPLTPLGLVRPRIIVGGGGSPRSTRIAARYADEFNVTSSTPEKVAEVQTRIDEACAAIGRDPGEITRSAMVGVMVGRDAVEVRERERALRAALEVGEGESDWLEERRTRWVLGTPEQAREAVARYAATGVERIMLQDFLPHDLAMIDLLGEELVGRG
jgi:F420-dependent oxidoreductase-like protein